MLCRKSNRLQIRNLPASTTKDDIQQLVGAFGTVQRCDLGWSDVILVVFVGVKVLLRNMSLDIVAGVGFKIMLAVTNVFVMAALCNGGGHYIFAL